MKEQWYNCVWHRSHVGDLLICCYNLSYLLLYLLNLRLMLLPPWWVPAPAPSYSSAMKIYTQKVSRVFTLKHMERCPYIFVCFPLLGRCSWNKGHLHGALSLYQYNIQYECEICGLNVNNCRVLITKRCICACLLITAISSGLGSALTRSSSDIFSVLFRFGAADSVISRDNSCVKEQMSSHLRQQRDKMLESLFFCNWPLLGIA